MKNIFPMVAGLCLLLATPVDAADKAETKKPATEAKTDSKETEEIEESYYEQLKRLLNELIESGEEATEKGKQMSEEAKAWVKDDFSKIGDWEYTQIVIKLKELPQMSKRLNELGKDRWDCFWVHQQGQEFHLLCKRPAISYLQKLGRVDIMKLISLGGDKE